MERLELPGRILYLAANEEAIRAQLAGRRLARAEAGALRDDVSTDEITPVPILTHYDEKLGRYPYTGLSVAGARPIGVDAIRAGGFSVTVAGKRYGKGSSREHSPAAERLAGIRLVVAESFERIYRQNADNIGLFTSTDFGLLDRIEAGEAIAVDELVQGRDALATAILKSGGLLRFGQRWMRDVRPAAGEPLAATPRTLFEKIVARHALSTELTPAAPQPGEGAFVRADWRFIHEYYTGMCAHMLDATFGASLALQEPDRIVAFEDHTSYVAESPAHVRGGLVPNVAAMCRAHRGVRRAPRSAHASHAHRRRSRRRRRQQRRRHLARDDGRALRAAGTGGGRHRLAHAAQRRARLRRVRGRHHRHGERVRDRRGAHHRAREPAHRPRGAAARRAHRQGHRASPAGAARDPRRRRRRQGVRVLPARSCARSRPTSARPSPT